VKKAVFHPYWGASKDEDLLGYPHAWVGDRYAQPLRELKLAGSRYGIALYGTNFSAYNDADYFFFWERPRIDDDVFRYALYKEKPMFLLATEPVTTVPMNGDEENSLFFDHIFTWYGSMSKRIHRIRPITFAFPKNTEKNSFADRKLCVMIASIYSRDQDPHELYSERAAAVRWFEENHPDELDFYGRQNRFTDTRFSLYKGPVSDKLEVLNNYKFQICYENTGGIRGYISEKIFDAFFAGCIPVYWGCEDISDYIPSDCLLDKREFPAYEKLYKRMKSFTQSEYDQYQGRIGEFLQSPFAQSYSEYSLVKTIFPICFNIEKP
jgi:hypothetical protein